MPAASSQRVGRPCSVKFPVRQFAEKALACHQAKGLLPGGNGSKLTKHLRFIAYFNIILLTDDNADGFVHDRLASALEGRCRRNSPQSGGEAPVPPSLARPFLLHPTARCRPEPPCLGGRGTPAQCLVGASQEHTVCHGIFRCGIATRDACSMLPLLQVCSSGWVYTYMSGYCTASRRTQY